MKSIVFILMVALFSAPAYAKIMAMCQMVRSTYSEDGEDNEQIEVREILEKEVVFVPGSGGVYTSNTVFSFRLSPSFETEFQISEKLVKGKISYDGTMVTRNRVSGKVLAKGFEEHEIETKPKPGVTRYYKPHCNAYLKTMNLERVELPLDLRERLRLLHFNGPAYRREYVEDNNPRFKGLYSEDHLDLFRQLMKIESFEGDFLRDSVARVQRLGRVPTNNDPMEHYGTWGSYNLLESGTECSVGGEVFTCDVEGFLVSQVFAYPRGLSRSLLRISVHARGRILRETGSRAIRGYIIDNVMTAGAPNGPAGGGSSTSGGRISGH